jgi:threonine synthase
MDQDLNQRLFLTSANSINVARWLPQQFYYFFAHRQWKEKVPPVVSVPSGNFGNICAGLLASRSGLPVQQFIAACNANDSVPGYLKTGRYLSKSAVPTLSNAMDVGNPSNFVRLLQLFHHDYPSLKRKLAGFSISDDETRQVMEEVFTKKGYLLDPHGAVGYLALQRYLRQHPDQKGYFLETAHPVKFYDVVEPVIHQKVDLPASVQHLLGKKKESIPMKAGSRELKEYLLGRQP